MMRKKISYLILLSVLVCSGSKVSAQKTDYRSYALYVVNFAKYTEWPSAESKTEVVIKVLGRSKIYDELKKSESALKASGRNLKIINIQSVSEAGSCHILVIPDGKSSSIKEVAKQLKNNSVLIIAEREGLAGRGAGIHFAVSEDDRLGFEYNPGELDSRHLKIAQRLLRLGKMVN